MKSTEKAIREFCGHHADWWPSTTQVQEMLALAQPAQELVIDCPRCGHCCPQRLVQELPPPLTKGQAWQKWWYETRGRHMVAGGAHPMEWAMYDAFNSGWDAAKQNSEKD